MSMVSGSFVRLKILSEVQYFTLFSPSIGGTKGLPPVAMHAFLNLRVYPFT
jgi:hypothetical protein